MNSSMLGLIKEIAILFPAFLFVFTFRGFFKAFIAYVMGDDTAKEEGFLTLNPFAHIDLVGLIILLCTLVLLWGLFPGVISRSILFMIIIVAGIRWVHPVPINEYNFKKPTVGIVCTSLAGPVGSFILALLFLYIVRYFPYGFFSHNGILSIVEVYKATIQLALWFGIFDLIPIPPFDGGKVIAALLPRSQRVVFEWLESHALYILLFLFLMPGVSDLFFYSIQRAVFMMQNFLLLLVF